MKKAISILLAGSFLAASASVFAGPPQAKPRILSHAHAVPHATVVDTVQQQRSVK